MSTLRILFVIVLFIGCISQPSPQPTTSPPLQSESPSPSSPPPESSLPSQSISESPTRTTISLDGTWELLPVKEDHLDFKQTKARNWRKIRVPHYLSVWDDVHRVWYKCKFTRIEAPRVTLAFNSVNFKCIVYVNDQLIGEHTGGYLPFEIEVTPYIKEENELLIGVEDVTAVFKNESSLDLLDGAPDNIFYPVGSTYHIFGLWQSVSLKTYPLVRIEDAYVKTSYRQKTIELEITLTNEDKNEVTLTVENVVDDLKFPSEEVTLKSSETKKIIITTEWKDPLLWCPENPHLYYLQTSLVLKNTLLDSSETRFGFREFWIEDGEFYLNGTAIHLRGSSKHMMGDPWTGDHEKDAKETLRRVKEVNSNALRLHANPYPHEFLDAADETGILIIDESALWCLSDQYDLGSDVFWENAQNHLTQLVLRDRNHPSLVVWSAENEILLCGGEHESRTREELIKLGDLIKSLDPTRPLMYEGDFDLPNADIINVHYPHEYPDWNLFPNDAYFLDNPFNPDTYPRTRIFWDREKPLYVGEFLWIPTFSPHPHTIFFGDEAFVNHELYRNKAKGEAWKMYVEAFRSQGVNGYCPWNVLEGGNFPTPLSEAVKEVYEPLFCSVKEYSTHFYPGEIVERTLVVCNDTGEKKNITLTWTAGSESGEHELTLGAAEHTEVKVQFKTPSPSEKETFSFTVTVQYGSEKVEIKKMYEVCPAEKITLHGTIALYDPVGETRKILDAQGIKYDLQDTLIPSEEYDLFIIGYHAIKEEDIPTVRKYHFQGRILCFEQMTLSPFGLTVTTHSSTITFERVPFGFDQNDLRFWRDDHVVSRNDIAKPRSGNFIPILDSGGSGGLEYVSLLGFYQEGGFMVFCQLLVTEKYDKEPEACLLFSKLLDYVLNTNWSPQTLGVVGDTELADFLQVDYEKASDFAKYKVLLVTGRADPVEVRTFVSGGGVAWLKLEPDELKKMVDVYFERVNPRDLPVLLLENELTYGLSNQEFYWTGERDRWSIPLSPEIAQYFILGNGTPLTNPCVLLKVPYGNGYFIVDTMQWKANRSSSSRIYSVLLTNLGIPISQPGVVIEAEAMKVEEVELGEKREGVYAFYTNGYLGTPVNFADSGFYTIKIYGWADVVNEKGAISEVYLDRRPVGKIEVTAQDVYIVEVFIEKGIHEMGIAFTNDFWEPPEDRNLYVDKTEISYKNPHNTLSLMSVQSPLHAKITPAHDGQEFIYLFLFCTLFTLVCYFRRSKVR